MHGLLSTYTHQSNRKYKNNDYSRLVCYKKSKPTGSWSSHQVYFTTSFHRLKTAMKILVACLLLSTISLTFAAAVSKESDEVSTFLQNFAKGENHQDMEENENMHMDEEDIATLQGLFNVLAQVDEEKAKTMDDENAMSQIWGFIGKGLLKYGKKYLKRRYCSEEQEMKVMLQELVGEQGNEAREEEENEAMAELQTTFNALQKANAKVMLVDNAQAEGLFKKLRRWAKKKVKRTTRRYLC